LAARLLTQYKQQISSLELQPSTGGCFELTVGDQLLYSKLATGEFPDEAKITAEVGKRL
jgi:selenoprotein W-related protein